MNAAADLSHEEEGVRAFRDLSTSMDRVGGVLARVETAQRSLLGDQQQASSQAVHAAGQAQRAAETALQVVRASQWPIASWTALAAVLGVLAGILGGFYLGRFTAWEAGQTAGYAAARDEQAAVHWANSPGGQTARKLEAAGNLTQLATCTSPGWRINTQNGRRICMVEPIQGSIYGWFLPDR